jgi:hypothetical protein
MELSEHEAKRLAEASAKVYAHYAPRLPKVSGEAFDIGMLAWTLSDIYAPRLLAGKIRREMEARKKREGAAPQREAPPKPTMSVVS